MLAGNSLNSCPDSSSQKTPPLAGEGNWAKSYIVFSVSKYLFWLTFLSSIKPFLAKKRLKNVATNSFRQQTWNVKKKILFSVSRLSKCIRIFWHFLIIQKKKYQFGGGAICSKPPFPRQMMTNQKVFSFVFCNLEGQDSSLKQIIT